ncbi:MAG: hypothetical protein ABR525_05765 [Candidatus Limnocylindria bacterium]
MKHAIKLPVLSVRGSAVQLLRFLTQALFVVLAVVGAGARRHAGKFRGAGAVARGATLLLTLDGPTERPA